MRNFSQFLEDRDHDLYSEIFGWGNKKKPVPTPVPEETPAEKYKRLRQQMQIAGDQDAPKDKEEAEYLAKWKK